MRDNEIKELRRHLMDTVRMEIDFSQTDQNLGIPMPPIQKVVTKGQIVIKLPPWEGVVKPQGSLDQLIRNRRSYRKFKDKALEAEELSYLLWATQGIRAPSPQRTLRNAPSAGNRHSLETYLSITKPMANKNGEVLFKRGLWRYLPVEHALVYLSSPEPLEAYVTRAALGQAFVGRAPVTFLWSTLPYRTEWRYSKASQKVIALDAGHVCQNLYLAAGSIGCGTCAIAAYDQEAADKLLHLPNPDEFIIYMAPVGKIIQGDMED